MTSDFKSSDLITPSSKYWSIFAIFCITIVSGIIFSFIAQSVLSVFFDISILDVNQITTLPNGRMALLIFQTISAPIGLFIIPSVIYMLYMENAKLSILYRNSTVVPFHFLVAFFIVIVSMPANSIIIEWNKNIDFPILISTWAKTQEEQAKVLTMFMSNFDSVYEFIFGFMVIAVLAGVSEEFFFRGTIQRILCKDNGNHHIAIWFTAFVFSLVHFQMYGFFPRLLLGALFGYLYHWSKDIRIPITSHVVNNGLTVIVLYFNKLGITKVDVENSGNILWYQALISAILTIGIIFLFKNKLDDKQLSSN